MKKIMFNKISIIVLAAMFIFGSFGSNNVFAATSPVLVGSVNYSVLGATTVTNTGASTTVGDVGVSAGASITGFLPGVAAGSNAIHLHYNDASAIAAQADNLTAFGSLDSGANAGANCIKATTGLAGSDADGTDLGGLTLTPGLYCSAGSFALTGTLTLTGVGPWVFKTASSLDAANGSIVNVPALTDACNVWWRVGSSATIGTTSAFKGNILALSSVSLSTNASLVGRAFAQTGAVTLDTNTITGCAAPLVAPNLTLNKIVAGGSSLESAWTVTATGPMTLSGLGAAGGTDVVGNVAIGTYDLSESVGPSNYDASTWSCVKNGAPSVVGSSISLTWADVAICTITNTYHAPSSGGGGTVYGCKDPLATNYNFFSASRPSLCVYANTTTVVNTPVIPVVTIPTVIPKLPKTGFAPEAWYSSLFSSFLNLFR